MTRRKPTSCEPQYSAEVPGRLGMLTNALLAVKGISFSSDDFEANSGCWLRQAGDSLSCPLELGMSVRDLAYQCAPCIMAAAVCREIKRQVLITPETDMLTEVDVRLKRLLTFRSPSSICDTLVT